MSIQIITIKNNRINNRISLIVFQWRRYYQGQEVVSSPPGIQEHFVYGIIVRIYKDNVRSKPFLYAVTDSVIS